MQLDSTGTDSEAVNGCLSVPVRKKQNGRAALNWNSSQSVVMPDFTDNLRLKTPLERHPSSFLALQTRFDTGLLEPRSGTREASGKAPLKISEV